MSQSVSFDRAAHFYDETRKLSRPVSDAITDAILDEMGRIGTDTLLEIGVGTGRISRPLAARDIHVLGVDISPLMMGRLLAQLAPADRTPDLFLGDATRLPLASGSVMCVLAVHVLHLVSSPEAAVAEMRRVLASGGVFLHQTHRDNGGLTDSGAWWDGVLRSRGLRMPRRSKFKEIGTVLQESGASVERRDVVSEEINIDPERVLKETRDKVHSWTWRIPEDVFDECWPDYEHWFQQRFGDRQIKDCLTYELETWRWTA